MVMKNVEIKLETYVAKNFKKNKKYGCNYYFYDLKCLGF